MMRSLAIAAVLAAASCGGGGGDSACSPACSAGQVCRSNICITPIACTVDADCHGDTYCASSAKECLPWQDGASDPSCQGEPVPGVFLPGVQCQWLGPPVGDPFPQHFNVLSTPMVAAFDPGAPSIVFTAYNGIDYGTPSCSGEAPDVGVIRVIDGRTCAQQATIAMPAGSPNIVGSAALAVGDLGGSDATPEIVAVTATGLVAFSRGPAGWTILWQAKPDSPVPCAWSGPSIHDLDDDGRPEVIFDGVVYNGQTGAVIDQSLSGTTDTVGVGYIPVVADVDGDGVPELITGNELYSWDKVNRRWARKAGSQLANGLVAVGDFGTFPDSRQDDRSHTDGIAETVVVLDGVVHVLTASGRQVFQATLVGAPGVIGQGGPPVLADFDGDGRLEIGVATAATFNVLDPDCQANPVPDAATCHSLTTSGVLWDLPINGQAGGKPSSSAFDFDGDGRPEAVNSDACFTRIFDGLTGKVLASRARTSCTWFEYPVIADSDADFRAELVVGSNNNCSTTQCPDVDPIFDGVQCSDDTDCPSSGQPMLCGRDQPGDPLGRCRCHADADCGEGYACRDPLAGPSPVGKVCRTSHGAQPSTGVQVLADTLDRWVSARPIWNQHAYSVTNVNDTGGVPRTSEWLRNWTQAGLNNFRQTTHGSVAVTARPDLTVRQAKVTCDAAAPTVSAEVCNRGSAPVGSGIPVAVYATTTPTKLRCQAQTPEPLAPGNCTTVSCAWNGPSGDGTVAVDDRGDGTGSARECREDNNLFAIHVACP